MSASVGTARAGSNRHTKSAVKAGKGDKGTSTQQPTAVKSEGASGKMQPTQEQLRLAQITSTGHADADPRTVKLIKELAELTGKSEDVVVIALHDTGNDADKAVMLLLEGGGEQGEWREQGGKRKKKASQKDTANHVSDEQAEGRNNKDRGDRDGEREKDGGSDRQDVPARKGRRNGGPPPRLARGRGRDRVSGGERDRNFTEDWDNDDKSQKIDKDRAGGDRGRSRGRGGFGRKTGTGGGRNRGSYNNSGDRDNRGFNRVPRFDKMNNSQPIDGPEIDTWTNETAETNTNKDTDWDNWKDSWVNEEDQWTGSLEETKVFSSSGMKIPDPEPAVTDPPSSLGQRLDVDSLFIESAKFSKAPDYSKPSGDAYITQFNQAATESIKNSIGIGSSSRQPLGMNQTPSSNPLGLSNLGQSSASAQSSVMSSLPQDPSHSSSMQHTMSQLTQITQAVPQGQTMSQMAMASQQAQVNNTQAPQSRIPSVMQPQQQQSLPAQASINNSLQQRPKPQRSKLPPPSKIPSSAVEMPGHIPRNTQLDLQFGIDFSSETSFGFGGGSGDSAAVTSSYSATTNGTSSVISNHLNQGHASQSSGDGASVSNILPSSSTPSKVPSGMESQTSNIQGVFHNSVYSASQTKNEGQSLDREQNKINDSISFPSSQLDRKSSPLSSQRPGQTSQNLSSGSITSSKNDVSNNMAGSSSTNFYTVSSYQNHQKGSIAHSTNQQPQQNSFPAQFSATQSAYQSSGQNQFPTAPNTTPFPNSGQTAQYNSTQNQFSSGQSQYSTGTSTLPHQPQYPAGAQNSYSGQSQYSGYQNSSSFPSHPPQSNFPSNQSGAASTGLYPTSTPPVSSYTSQSNSYQSPSAGSYHSRDSQAGVPVSTQSSSGVSFPSQAQSSSLKPASTQSGSNYNSQSFNASPAPLQPSALGNKLGDSLSKMSIKDSVLENHQSSQFEHSSSSSSSVPTSLSLPSATCTSLSSGTNTISSLSTATSVTSTSRVVSMPSASKAPPNLPPGVPLMGQYIMGQSTMPPFYSVQPPLYGYEDVQLVPQRVPLQTGSYYDMSPFPAQAGSTLPTGRDQQPPIPNVPFSGTSDTSKMPRVDAQSPNASTQPQNAHSAAQQPLFNFHYSYIYPSTMFPAGAAGLQYPTMFPIPPVTNTAAHAGTTATTQFQKTYPSHVYSTKGYDELNQAQDFSKSGYGSSQNSGKASGTRMSTRSATSEITPNAYNKSHTQGFDKQGYHGGTPPPYSLPLASATQAGPLGAPTTPYGAAPFLPMMAAHQPHSQMMHHPIQQDSSSSSSRGLNQTGSQSKTGAGKAYAGPTYWGN